MANAARHLHDLLEEFRKRAGNVEAVKGAKGEPTATVVRNLQGTWAGVFGLPISNKQPFRALFFRFYGILHDLPVIIERDLRCREDIDLDLFLEWKPSVEAALRQNLNNSAETASKHVTSATLLSLRHCSSMLGGGRGVAPEKLQELENSVTELRSQVIEDDEMNIRVRGFIGGRLDEILEALQEYRLRGDEALRDVLDSCIGKCCTSPEVASKIGEKEKLHVGGFLSVLNMLSAALNIGDKLPQLGKGAKLLLLGE